MNTPASKSIQATLANLTKSPKANFRLYTDLTLASCVADRDGQVAILVDAGYVAVTTPLNGEKLQALGYEAV